jgi:ABC-2 type transport system permease protein
MTDTHTIAGEATWLRPDLRRIFRAEVRDEMLGIVREPAALFFSVVMPVAFFALFIGMFGSAGDGMGIEAIATYGTFGVLSVIVMNPGIGLADARERGWVRVQRASGTPLPISLAARVTAGLPYAFGTLAAITAVSLATGAIAPEWWTLAKIITVLIIGGLPFSLFSLAVGARMSPNGATAVLNAVLIPSVVASGLWFPLEIMPEFMQRIAVFMPPYHLAGLALSQVDGSPWLGHAVYLVGTLIVGSILAAVAYRSARP